MKTVRTLAFKYHRCFEPGERVRSISPRCPLPAGMFEVARCIWPTDPAGEMLASLKAHPALIPTAYLMSESPPPEFDGHESLPVDDREFLGLQLDFPLRLIRNEEEYDRAVQMRDTLLDLIQRSEAVEEYLRTLALLIANHGRKDAPPAPYRTDGDVLDFLLSTRGVSAREVARATKIQASALSRVRSGEARFTRSQIAALIEYFHIEPTVFFTRRPDQDEIARHEELDTLARLGNPLVHG